MPSDEPLTLISVIRRFVPQGTTIEACARGIGVSRPTLFSQPPSPETVRRTRRWLHQQVKRHGARNEVDVLLTQLVTEAALQRAGLVIPVPERREPDSSVVSAVLRATRQGLPIRQAVTMLEALEESLRDTYGESGLEVSREIVLGYYRLGWYSAMIEAIDATLATYGQLLPRQDEGVLLMIRGYGLLRAGARGRSEAVMYQEAEAELHRAMAIRSGLGGIWSTGYRHPEHYLARLYGERSLRAVHGQSAGADYERSIAIFDLSRDLHARGSDNDRWLGRDDLWEAHLEHQWMRSGGHPRGRVDPGRVHGLLARARNRLGIHGVGGAWVTWQNLLMTVDAKELPVQRARARADEVFAQWADEGYGAGIPDGLVEVAEWLAAAGDLARARQAVAAALCIVVNRPDPRLLARVRRLGLTVATTDRAVQRQADTMLAAANRLEWPFGHIRRLGFSPAIRLRWVFLRHDLFGRPVPHVELAEPPRDEELD
ncbi:MAG: hypothetical protein E6J41_17760 [Chloroflexi bacterium]|nr:MAG: hypothetical protein E6J41_17760 [Chloroflexota bacterium]